MERCSSLRGCDVWGWNGGLKDLPRVKTTVNGVVVAGVGSESDNRELTEGEC